MTDNPVNVATDPVDLWVFGYGSLMWRPGFEYLECVSARLNGYRRALCIWSWVHRGTEEQPGLVFGLDAGGSCIGKAFRVAATERTAVTEYLYEREMVTAVYRPRELPLRLADDRRVTALTFIADRSHPQYAGRLSPEQAAQVVAQARGRSGPNREYLQNTVRHLRELAIHDGLLVRLDELLGQTDSDKGHTA